MSFNFGWKTANQQIIVPRACLLLCPAKGFWLTVNLLKLEQRLLGQTFTWGCYCSTFKNISCWVNRAVSAFDDPMAIFTEVCFHPRYHMPNTTKSIELSQRVLWNDIAHLVFDFSNWSILAKNLISDGIFPLVPSSQKCAKSLDLTFQPKVKKLRIVIFVWEDEQGENTLWY